MSVTLYDITIPVLVRALEQLQAVVKKGQQWAKDNGKDEESLLQAKISDDMNPLSFQLHTCANTSKALLHRIGGQENVPVEDNEKTWAEFHARLESTIKLLRDAKKENFVAPDATCKVKMGPYEADFTGLAYVQKFLLPNFFFHHVTAYDILRKEGVPVGKTDYLGASDITTWEL